MGELVRSREDAMRCSCRGRAEVTDFGLGDGWERHGRSEGTERLGMLIE